MKHSRFPLILVAAAATFLAPAGCARRTEPDTKTADSADQGAKPGWLISYEQAQQKAKAGNKLMLLDFTGSDWCGWCIKIDKEIFSKPQFKEYASKNLVLLELDFPRAKKLAVATQAQNERLAQKYQIQGFPTIVVLNGDGKQVGELGYVEGGPAAFIAQLEKLRKG